MTQKCCKITNCTHENCDPHPSCNGNCKVGLIHWDDNQEQVTMGIPYFIFEQDLEYAQTQMDKAVELLWLAYNQRTTK